MLVSLRSDDKNQRMPDQSSRKISSIGNETGTGTITAPPAAGINRPIIQLTYALVSLKLRQSNQVLKLPRLVVSMSSVCLNESPSVGLVPAQ